MMADAALLAPWVLWSAQHALAIFFAVLGLLLAATAASNWVLPQYAAHRRQAALVPALPQGLRSGIGMAVVLIGVGVFAALAALLATGGIRGWSDQAFTAVLRAAAPTSALQVFAALTHLGDTTTLAALCIAIALALIAFRRRGFAFAWVVAVAGNGLLIKVLKQLFGRVRPLNSEGFVLEHGFSFPSGHSSGAVVAYGMLAYLALRLLPLRWHLPSLFATVTLALTVGASRLFLGVHFASDVIAGFASGTAWLALCITSIEYIRRRNQQAV
jgi:undecaprenyl-diphosphatase